VRRFAEADAEAGLVEEKGVADVFDRAVFDRSLTEGRA
jgi:hypothetical protein